MVLVLEQITARQREYLLREKVAAFIVDGKQIYLPFIILFMREQKSTDQAAKDLELSSFQSIKTTKKWEGKKIGVQKILSSIPRRTVYKSRKLCLVW